MMEEMAPKGMPEEAKEGGDFNSLLSSAQESLAKLVESAPGDKQEQIAGILAQLSEVMEPSQEQGNVDMMSGGKKGAKPAWS